MQIRMLKFSDGSEGKRTSARVLVLQVENARLHQRLLITRKAPPANQNIKTSTLVLVPFLNEAQESGNIVEHQRT